MSELKKKIKTELPITNAMHDITIEAIISLCMDEAIEAVKSSRLYEGNWESIDWNKPLDKAVEEIEKLKQSG